MSKMVVEFEWDEKNLGPFWMCEDNLAILLYTDTATKRELLSFEVLSHTDVEKRGEE